MKRFLLKLGILTFILLIVDYTIGNALAFVVGNIEVGGQGRDNYISDKCEDDIIVLGSSRAVHHYNSTLLGDSLSMTCYNCGDNGSGIILSYGRLLMIKERHQPKIIIQDIFPNFDLMMNDNHKYLGWLKAHYAKECLHPIFDDVDKTEKYKMKSYLYRYNSRFLQNLVTYFTGWSNDDGICGFRPKRGEFDRMKTRESDELNDDNVLDTLKLAYIHKLIDLSENAKLIFVVSPRWYGMDSLQFQPIIDICQARGIPFIDFANNPKYVHQDIYFKDGNHMNERGANEFTKDLIGYLKDKMLQ